MSPAPSQREKLPGHDFPVPLKGIEHGPCTAEIIYFPKKNKSMMPVILIGRDVYLPVCP